MKGLQTMMINIWYLLVVMYVQFSLNKFEIQSSYYTPSLLWPMFVKEWQTMGNKIAIFQLFYSMVLIYDILHIFQTIYESVIFSFFWSICHALYKNLTIV